MRAPPTFFIPFIVFLALNAVTSIQAQDNTRSLTHSENRILFEREDDRILVSGKNIEKLCIICEESTCILHMKLKEKTQLQVESFISRHIKEQIKLSVNDVLMFSKLRIHDNVSFKNGSKIYLDKVQVYNLATADPPIIEYCESAI
ncbi:hypothetical protein JCM17846_31490 [Iodidimonas nitroreducens]|uniref:Uncharacterized protein n=1 Tax=Iodidimonas nitroreducens TaxID=1236968 RepID=A0A5A7NBZ8_9PROT|nr:hypothetical protein [Iodidimonas nitroreducens]GAK34496.1 hypothetical protein AQ1_02395 [alpha proteobacterium Q-1]GER05467.1 hypothetical protein JCM17846_31490 [Iodidimonas nitroreducens]